MTVVRANNLAADRVREHANGSDSARVHYAGLGVLDFATMCGACWPEWTPEPVPRSSRVTCKPCLAVAEWAMSATGSRS